MSEPNPIWGEDDILDAMLEFDPAPATIMNRERFLGVAGRRGNIYVSARLSIDGSYGSHVYQGTTWSGFSDPIEAIQYALALSRE